ncbi:Lichenan-specific phosphotransferase enzyme IIA component [bioreactor metagenome]|uniref:Lichenan-specific phosphotransferase enzyme IIA component n=1 Tax=bioreactor metagenome TaxID=1076179 RepID=A0A645F9S1_9ZZZZ
MDEIEENENSVISLILHSGNASSRAMEAIYASRNKNFDEAEVLLADVKNELALAHREHMEILAKEARGEKFEVNILLMHALDHMSQAHIVYELAKEIVLMRQEYIRKDEIE